MSTARSRGKELESRLQRYLEYYLGMTFETKRAWNNELKKKMLHRYLAIKFPKWLEKETCFGSEQWVRGKFLQYDKFKGIPSGSEFRFNKARKDITEFCNKHCPSKYWPFSRFVLQG